MNIAHIMKYMSAVYGGVAIGTKRMVSALSHLGINISVWATGNQGEEEELPKKGVSCYLYKTERPVSWQRSPDLARALGTASKTYDIFHIHEVWDYPQYMAARTARKKSIPYILAPRASLEPWRMMRKSFKKNIYLNLIGDALLNKSTCLHAVSTAEVDGFRKVGYRGPVFIAHNGVVPEEFVHLPNPFEADQQWPMLKGRRVVLFLSRLSPEKGLDVFIKAWSDVIRKPSYSDAFLILAGPDDRGYSLKVKQMIHDAGIEENVLLPGMVEGRSKFALMSRADIYALPSYSEGFSNSLLENLASGNPVLITPGCNFPEVAEAGAGLCVNPQRDALSEALMQLLGMSRDDLMAMGGKGRRLVLENYTWDIAARKIATVYQAIIQGKAIPLHPEPIPLNTNGKAIFN